MDRLFDVCQQSSREITPADYLFLAVDQQVIQNADNSWRIKVYGVHTDPCSRASWLQVEFTGEEPYAATVRVNEDENPMDVFAAISQWLALPGRSGYCTVTAPADSRPH